MKTVAKKARKEAPPTFRQPGTFTPEGFILRRLAEGTELALAFHDPQLTDERQGLIQGIDLAAGQWHRRWHRNYTYTIKVATLGAHIEPEILDEIQAVVPEPIAALPGVARPVKD